MNRTTNGFTVNVAYQDKERNEIATKNYDLTNYTEMLRYNILKILIEVESMASNQQGTEDKNKWDKDTMKSFNSIRHTILDCANAVARIPENLRYNGYRCVPVEATQVFADIINTTM